MDFFFNFYFFLPSYKVIFFRNSEGRNCKRCFLTPCDKHIESKNMKSREQEIIYKKYNVDQAKVFNFISFLFFAFVMRFRFRMTTLLHS